MSIAGSLSRQSADAPVVWSNCLDRSDGIALAALLASAGCFYAAPWAPVYLVALAVTVGLAIWRPILSLTLVPAFTPFFMQPKYLWHVHPAPQEVFLGVAIVALAVGVARGTVEATWRDLATSRFAAPAALFVVATGVSSVFAVEQHLAFRALYQVVLEPVVYFGLLMTFARRDRDWWAVVWVIVAVGVLVACIGIGQQLTGIGLSTTGSAVQRVRALYGSPDNLGLFLDRVIPLVVALILFRRWRGGELGVLLAACTMLVVTLGLTFSRGAWFGVGGAVVVLMVFRPGWTRWCAVGLVVVAALGGVAKYQSIVNALQIGHSHTASKRIDIWRSSVSMVRDHPVLGIGPDNFNHYYAPRHGQQLYTQDNCWGEGYLIDSNAAVSQEPCLSHPHNLVLDFWLSSGILGVVAIIWLQAVFWRNVWMGLRRTLSRSTLALSMGIGGAMLASLLHGLVDNSYFLMDLAILFWTLFALSTYVARGTVSGGSVGSQQGAP
jgi:putative inorganic carbon (hco3(-)) transporter